MKRASCLFVSLVVFTAGFLFNTNASALQGTQDPQPQTGPQVAGARLKGKKLYVVGERFDEGSVVLVDGQPQKTKSDPDDPEQILIAKKAGKKMPVDALVGIQVQTSAGATSEDFDFFTGTTISLEDGGKTFQFHVGDKFMLVLKRDRYNFTAGVEGPEVIQLVKDAPIAPGAQGVFEAKSVGETTLVALGTWPCPSGQIQCGVPAIRFEVHIKIVA